MGFVLKSKIFNSTRNFGREKNASRNNKELDDIFVPIEEIYKMLSRSKKSQIEVENAFRINKVLDDNFLPLEETYKMLSRSKKSQIEVENALRNNKGLDYNFLPLEQNYKMLSRSKKSQIEVENALRITKEELDYNFLFLEKSNEILSSTKKSKIEVDNALRINKEELDDNFLFFEEPSEILSSTIKSESEEENDLLIDKELDDNFLSLKEPNKILSRSKKPQIKVSKEIDVKKIAINNVLEMKKLNLQEYWYDRRYLFSKYYQGIALDAKSWYSVTPERITKMIAQHCSRNMVVVDAMCGAGGNAIQFAKTCKKVIAIDIDPNKIALARHNAKIYKVTDRIEFIDGDFFEIAPTLNADVVFLSFPWDAHKYQNKTEVVIEDLIGGRGLDLFRTAKEISPNIIFLLPQNINKQQLYNLASSDGDGYIELQSFDFGGRVRAITAYYGELLVK